MKMLLRARHRLFNAFIRIVRCVPVIIITFIVFTEIIFFFFFFESEMIGETLFGIGKFVIEIGGSML